MEYYVLLFTIFAPYLVTSKIHKLNDYDAYYWRDFNGIIPSDAFSAGTSNNGNNVYIAQILHKTLLIPGKILINSKNAFYEYGSTAWSTEQNIKIFCTNFPHLFEWYETSKSNFVSDKNYVIGGYEPGYTVFIGRALEYKGDISVGKVVFNKDHVVLLHSTYEGQSIRIENFQVLLFTPIFINSNVFTTSSPNFVPFLRTTEGYYWRDFKGTIPMDAFAAGNEGKDEPLYIVQALYKEILIPGVLDKDKKTAVFEYATQKWTASTNFKILCTDHPQFLQWKKTDTCIFSVRENNIIGGYEPKLSVFIGRGLVYDQLVVGKIILRDDNLPQLHTIFNDESIRLKMYETLIYEPTNTQLSSSTAFTTRRATTTKTTIPTKMSTSTLETTRLLPKTEITSEKVTETQTVNKFEQNITEDAVSELSKHRLNTIFRKVSQLHVHGSNNCKCEKSVYIININ